MPAKREMAIKHVVKATRDKLLAHIQAQVDTGELLLLACEPDICLSGYTLMTNSEHTRDLLKRKAVRTLPGEKLCYWDISSGWCVDFIRQVREALGPGGKDSVAILWLDSKIDSDDWTSPRSIYHVVGRYGRYYFDAQNPEGVTKLSDLYYVRGETRDEFIDRCSREA